MFNFARYYRVFKAIQGPVKKAWSNENTDGPQSLVRGEKTSKGRPWDPPYAPAQRPSNPSQKLT